jgi:hypothetical protein
MKYSEQKIHRDRKITGHQGHVEEKTWSDCKEIRGFFGRG